MASAAESLQAEAGLAVRPVDINLQLALHPDQSIADMSRGLMLAADVAALGLVLGPKELSFGDQISRLAKELRPDLPVVAAGPLCAEEGSRAGLFDAGVDYLVEGDTPEAALGRILGCLIRGKKPLDVPGVFCSRHMPPFPHQPQPADQDLPPWPRYDDFNLAEYAGKRRLLLETFRGNPKDQSSLRYRPVQDIVDQLRHHRDHLRVRHVTLCDPAANFRARYLAALCRQLKDQRLGVPWDCHLRPIPNLDRPTLMDMRAAGCTTVRFHLNMATDLGLDRNQSDADGVIRAVFACHQAGLQTAASFQVVHPSEQTDEDFQRALEMVSKIAPVLDRVTAVVSTPRAKPGVPVDRHDRALRLVDLLCGTGASVNLSGCPLTPQQARRLGAKGSQARRSQCSLKANELEVAVDVDSRQVLLSGAGGCFTSPPGIMVILELEDEPAGLSTGRWRCKRTGNSLKLEVACQRAPLRLQLRFTPGPHGLRLDLDLLVEQPVRLRNVQVACILAPA